MTVGSFSGIVEYKIPTFHRRIMVFNKSENRKSKRLPLYRVIEYVPVTTKYSYVMRPKGAIIRDISEEGISIATPERIREGSILSLMLTSKKSVYKLCGKVLWAKLNKKGDQYYIGIKFINHCVLSKEQLEKLVYEVF